MLDSRDTHGPAPKSLEHSGQIRAYEHYMPYSTQRLHYFDGSLRDSVSRAHNFIGYVPSGVIRASQRHTLFHYTKGANLENIVSSGELWGSRLSTMNDHQEIEHTKNHFGTQLSNVMRDAPNAKAVIRRALSEFDQQVARNIYCVSLSNRGNELSQWVHYSDRSGASLGFAYELLAKAEQAPHHWRVVEVEYDASAQAAEMKRVVEQFLAMGLGSVEDSAFPALFRSSCRDVLAEMACRFKHPGFAGEGELRLVKDAEQHPHDLRTHPAGGGRMYTPFNWAQLQEEVDVSDVHFPHVFCSPNASSRHALQRMDRLLSKHQRKFGMVIESLIPYRW